MKITKLLLAILSISATTSVCANVLATTTAFGRSAEVNEVKEVSSLHDVYIYNPDPYLKVYTMKYILCTQNTGCKSLDEFVYLNPFSSFRKQTRVAKEFIYYMRGNYQVTAETFIRTNTTLESQTTGKAIIQIHR